MAEELEACQVTDDDRAAAGAFLRANERFWLDRNGKIMRGEADDDPLVQAFARHRIETYEAAMREAAEIADGVAKAQRGLGEARQRARRTVSPANPHAHRSSELEIGALRVRDEILARIPSPPSSSSKEMGRG